MSVLNQVACVFFFAAGMSQAQDVIVKGNLTVNGDTAMLKSMRIDGPIGIGVQPAGSGLQIFQGGAGVGVFLGDRRPFGQALLETDLTLPATHAFFAENGNRVFSVTAGGNGFFQGTLGVAGDANVSGGFNVTGDAQFLSKLSVQGLDVGSAEFGSGQDVQIFGERSFPGGAATRLKILVNGNIGIGISTPEQKLHVAGNARIEQILQVGNRIADTGLGGGTINPNNPRLQVGGNVAINGNQAITGNQGITGNQVITGNQRITGDQTFDGAQNFGVRARQMINLFGKSYGIGVQDSGLYLRSDFDFFWYRRGGESLTFADPGRDNAGTSGSKLMQLDRNGLLTVQSGVVTPMLQITGGSDVAEPFNIAQPDVRSGSVVVIDQENAGNLKLSERAYDTRVAGIVSGANGINPGLSLRQQGVFDGGQNVALSGRVYVLADASANTITPGDLLTTSDLPGYAMKVTDHIRAQGAVLGKAMSALKSGRGLVLVLVTLQ